MKTLVRTLVLSLIFGSVSFVSFGSERGRHDNHRQRTHKEMTVRSRPGNSSAPRPGHGAVNPPRKQVRPATPPRPPRRPAPAVRPASRPLPPPPSAANAALYNMLSHMVASTIGGGQMVDLWQVSEDAYLLKYRLGNRYYSRYLYPYSGSYGSRNVISVGWHPSSFLSLIPAINLNINL